ncbi:MAG: hypothetical protein O3B43_00460 [Chloroflexi bacterium]|nr:hypothetical protein [Chloroflexota bacterium]
MRRYIIFLAAIAIGLLTGLYYGWSVNPVQGTAGTSAQLRSDYQADYVLMVAETYRSTQNPEESVLQLAFLGEVNPVLSMDAAMTFAETNGFARQDIKILRDLYNAVLEWDPSLALTLTPDG